MHYRHARLWERAASTADASSLPPLDCQAIAALARSPRLTPHRGRNAADRTILDTVRRSLEPGSICVYTSDRDLANALKPLGVTVRSAGSFRRELDDACNPFT